MRLRSLLLLGLLACDAPVEARQSAPAAPAASAASFSVHDLGAEWRDQHGAVRTLSSLGGRPQVIAMVYTHCSATCPLTVAVMKRIEAVAGDRVGLVLVSLDPDRDTPQRLATYAAEHALDDARWTLLRGSDDAVRELAAVLGVRYRRASAQELAHTNTLTVVDARGVVVHQTAALGDADGTIAAVQQLIR